MLCCAGSSQTKAHKKAPKYTTLPKQAYFYWLFASCVSSLPCVDACLSEMNLWILCRDINNLKRKKETKKQKNKQAKINCVFEK